MKLISMVEFVLEQENRLINAPINSEGVKQLREYITSTSNYANFLKQPLTLGMFDGESQLFRCELFHNEIICEGHNVKSIINNLKTVEDLLFMSPELTSTALKQIGLTK